MTTLEFGSGTAWEVPVADDPHEVVQQELGPTDIQRIVTQIGAPARSPRSRYRASRGCPRSSAVYELADLPTKRRDDELVIGISDDPDSQSQPPISFRPDIEGNLAVFGASGSGKSALLRTVAVAAGYTVRGGPCHVYALDFGNRGLAMIEPLPHVGSVVYASDHERVVRLLTMLRETIDERALRYSAVNAATITDFRRLAGRPTNPASSCWSTLYQLPGCLRLPRGTTLARPVHLAGRRRARPWACTSVVTADQRRAIWGASPPRSRAGSCCGWPPPTTTFPSTSPRTCCR